jgi:hypothetical protein
MALNNNRTWTEYYEQEGGNIPMLQFTNNKELEHFDLMTLGMTDDPAALLGATSTYPYNWMIVAGPSTQRRLNIIHHAFSVATTPQSWEIRETGRPPPSSRLTQPL